MQGSSEGPGAVALRALPTAGSDPGRVAIIGQDGARLTHGQLADRASRLAAGLRGLGLREADVVALVVENVPEYLVMTWACRLSALYYVTVNTRLTAGEAAFILRDSGAVAVIASDRVPVTADLTPDLAPAVRSWVLRGPERPGWVGYDEMLAAAAIFDEGTALEGDLLQYSSGTTGRPKGIKRALRPAPATPAEDTYTFLAGLIGVDGSSHYLCPAPLYHSAPCYWSMGVLRVGGTVVLMERFDAAAALELIERHRVTHGQFVPTMFVRMLRLPRERRLAFDVSSLRGVVHAAAPCPVGVKRAMLDWWGPIIAEYWSSSEGAGFTWISADDWLTHPGSVGRSLMGALHIRDDSGRELPPGEPGRIWAEGAAWTYLNDPEKDAAGTSPEGWRSVGDIGRLDADGYLYLTDRADFTINSGGVNVYPQEAEDALLEHPRVHDAAVVGVPDDDLGEIPVAVVQPVDPAEGGPEFAAELTAWSQGRLARHKCPRRISFAPDLPRSDTGKLYKKRVREELLADRSVSEKPGEQGGS